MVKRQADGKEPFNLSISALVSNSCVNVNKIYNDRLSRSGRGLRGDVTFLSTRELLMQSMTNILKDKLLQGDIIKLPATVNFVY